ACAATSTGTTVRKIAASFGGALPSRPGHRKGALSFPPPATLNPSTRRNGGLSQPSLPFQGTPNRNRPGIRKKSWKDPPTPGQYRVRTQDGADGSGSNRDGESNPRGRDRGNPRAVPLRGDGNMD